MLDRVSVLIPYQSDGNGPRDTAFEWVLGFYARMMPEVEVCVGEIADARELFSDQGDQSCVSPGYKRHYRDCG